MDHHLQVFVAVADRKSFSKAGEDLHLTQPAVSQHIRVLEEEYGVKLFDRTNKQVRLTKAGELLYVHAKEILRQYHQVQRLIDDLTQNAHGPLMIGSSLSFGEYVLPHIVAGFKGRYPRISPMISIENTKNIAERISKNELDIGIVEGAVNSKLGLVVKPFLVDQLVLIVGPTHRLSGQSTVSPADLQAEHWIVREPGSGTREASEHLFEETAISPATLMECGSTQAIKESVEAGLGISLVSEWTIKKELALSTLHAIHLDGYEATREFSFIFHRSQFRTKAVDLFVDFLLEFLA